MSLPRLFKPFQPFTGRYVHDLINRWFDTDPGADTLRQEQALLNRILPSMFGYYLMQAGVGKPKLKLEASPIKHRFYVCEEFYPDAPMACVQSRISDLSVAPDTIDVVLLHHSLDFDNNPHGLLREVTRTLIPGGKLVVVGFNPWSFLGVCRLLKLKTPDVPWCGKFLSPYRVSDWLNLLDFEVEGCETTRFCLPNTSRVWTRYFGWLGYPFKDWWSQRGGVYIMVATKRVAKVTPIKEAKRTAPLVPIPLNGIARPSPRVDLPKKDF